MPDYFDYPEILLTFAVVLMLLSITVKNMLPLRAIAFAAAAVFTVFAFIKASTILVVLAVALLIIGGYRLYEVQNVSRKIRRTRHYGYEIEQLLPLMAEIELPPGQIIFSKGDHADRLFFLTSGEVEIVENGKKLPKDTLFGEIGLFTGTGERTSTIRCVTDCTLRTMTSVEVDKLYFTQPEFALALVKIMATRMTKNIEALESKIGGKE
jgi:membrane protein implicated in regulation of membrane protease activity